MIKAFTADRIFTGKEWLHYYAMIVEDGVVKQLVPASCLPASLLKENFPDSFIAPAFVDLQIYGAHGKLLAAYPTAESLHLLNNYCNSGGAAYCLPTVATNTREVFFACIDAVRSYWSQGGQGILGLHLEGPWINPVRRGAHVEALIHAPAKNEVKELLDYGKDVIRMITLAPEVCEPWVIEELLSRNILISAGHSNATYEQAIHAFNHGVKAVTHLYNAMSPLHHRAPGLVGASMDHHSVMASIIPDGHHVDYASIRIAKQVMHDRLFVITDAVTDTESGPYQHYPAGDKYEAAGVLSGSALTMNLAVKNLVENAGIDLEEALCMCSLIPARVIGLENEISVIRKDAYTRAVVLKNDLDVVRMI